MRTRIGGIVAAVATTVALVAFAAAIGGTTNASSGPDAPEQSAQGAGTEMLDAARAFLELLDDDQAERAQFEFEDEERFNWHFVPRERNGLPLKDMTPEQRGAAHDLLRSTLSSQGYLKATSIMFLESILQEIEERGPTRDPENYFVSVFGEPSVEAPWGWRFEGHHLALNYSSVAGDLAVTPAFMGANPEQVPLGPAAGLRVLAAEEDLARALVTSLNPEQRRRAIFSQTAPDDILTGNDRRPNIGEPEGLPAAAMNEAQQATLRQVIEEYVRNMTHDVAVAQMKRIDEAGFDSLHFSWAGGLEHDEPHYYRIHGPTVVFEYDNTQNDAQHPHSVWRDLTDDFGVDLLKQHYEESPHH